MIVAFHAIGEFNRSDVVARWVDQPVPRIDIEKQIEQAWRQASPGPASNCSMAPCADSGAFTPAKNSNWS